MIKNFLILVGGTAFAQMISIASTPLLTRLFSPQDFGILGSILAVSAIISVIGSMKYDMAIVLGENNKEASYIQFLSIIILCLLTIVLFLFTLITPSYLFEIIGLQFNVFWLIPLFFFISFNSILSSRLNREEMYKQLSLSQIIKRLVIVFSLIIFGYIGFGPVGLIIGNILGVALSTLYLYIYNIDFLNFKNEYSNYKYFTEIANKYRQFPIYTVPQTLLNTFIIQLPIIFLGSFYSVQVVGAYFLTVKIIQLPTNLLGQSVRRIFYKEASKNKDNIYSLRRIYNKITISLLAVTFIPTILLYLFSEPIFIYVFGDDWLLSGKFAKYMILWFSAVFVMSPTRILFIVLNKQSTLLVLDTVLGIMRLLVLLIAYYGYTPLFIISLYSILSCTFYVSTIFGWQIYFYKKNIVNT